MITTLKHAIEDAGGPTAVGRMIGLTSPRAIYKWIDNDALPRTEYTGETDYADTMAKASKGAYTSKQLRDAFRPGR